MQLGVLDWVLIGLLTGAIIFFVLLLAFLLGSFLAGRKLSSLRKRRPKSKKKRRKWARQVKKVQKQRNGRFKLAILFLLLGISCGGGSYYTNYYQMTNLGDKDSEALVQGYFLIDKIEETFAETEDSPVKQRDTLYDLSARLASYGANSPDNRLSKEGTLLMKRLYTSMKELGLNLSSITEDTIRNEEVVAEYLEDIGKVKENQQKVFKYFRINESSLKQDT